MDPAQREFVESFRVFIDEVIEKARGEASDREPITAVIERHLGQDPRQLPVVSENLPRHQLINLDVAMAALLDEHGGGTLLGVGGGDQRQHHSLGEMLERAGHWRMFGVSAPDFSNLPVGPDEQRQVVSFGIHLFHYNGEPVAALQRAGEQLHGNGDARLEIVAGPDVAARVLADVRRLMVERSVFRGKVLTLGAPPEPYMPGIAGISFIPRPQLAPDEVILPAGTLSRIERHIGGPARHRDQLRQAGQHLKRGILLYGPPGTGKTHTVRYLVGALPETTVVLLSGTSLQYVTYATELARALQPAIVVLEDVDLIAEQRNLSHDPQPLLFSVLEAMDGLTSDADIAFVLTTNRADLLEPALAQRPGRVDLGVEIPLPDAAARRALLGLYAREIPFSTTVLDDVAERGAGTTASFAKELIRRAVLTAAEAGHDAGDDDLTTAAAELMDESQRLTRVLLGSAEPSAGPEPAPGGGFQGR